MRWNLSLKERFDEKVDKDGPDGCWIWLGSVNNKGYGQIYVEGFPRLAHRIAYEMAFGKPPPKIKVLHRCDRPACVRPSHLFLGTQADNMADCKAKGRVGFRPSPGEAHGMHKLTDEEVLAIRASTISPGALAEFFNVTYQTVWNIQTGRTWRHLRV